MSQKRVSKSKKPTKKKKNTSQNISTKKKRLTLSAFFEAVQHFRKMSKWDGYYFGIQETPDNQIGTLVYDMSGTKKLVFKFSRPGAVLKITIVDLIEETKNQVYKTTVTSAGEIISRIERYLENYQESLALRDVY